MRPKTDVRKLKFKDGYNQIQITPQIHPVAAATNDGETVGWGPPFCRSIRGGEYINEAPEINGPEKSVEISA